MNQRNPKILDCTLRDGGYVNNWNFGLEGIKFILKQLFLAKIDYIETGFLTDRKVTENQSLFNNIYEINAILPENSDKKQFFAMISYGKYDVNRLPEYSDELIYGIRFIFKNQDLHDALKLCRQINNKGYRLFINPTFINQYNKTELVELVKTVNDINPFGFSVVDSTGGINEKRLADIFSLIDEHLNKNITLCFHSHDNLGLSFNNTKILLNMGLQRPLVIDSSVSGVGRGAGNLRTEVLINHLNDNFNTHYKISPIQNIIEKVTNNLAGKWGYTEANYLAGVNLCHPYYASYLNEKNDLTPANINNILKNIPENKKNIYDKNLIERLYLDTKCH